MKSRLLIFLLLANATAWAQDTIYAHKVLYELCSKKYHGRGYYKKGEIKAGKYIAKEMKNLGLEPANNACFFQEFELKGNSVKQAKLEINGIKIPLGTAWLPSPNAGVRMSHESHPITWLQVDSNTTKEQLMEFMKRNENDGPLFIDTFGPNSRISPRDIGNAAQLHNIDPLVYMTASDFNHNIADGSNPSFNFSICYKYLPIELLDIRTWRNVKMKANGRVKTHELSNVMGMIKGKNTDSTIIVCAHYDHLGQVGKEAIFYGANDNACGIAMLLDLAKYYKQNQPEFNMMFIAFAAEEAGLVGSSVYINNPVVPLSSTKFVLNLDLVGTGQTGATVVNATVFPEHYAKLVAVNDKGKYIPELHRRGKAANSDHYWFTEKGIPSFFVYFEGTRSSYHDVFDIPESLPLVKFMDGRNLFIQFINTL
jgi:hypothetical protein